MKVYEDVEAAHDVMCNFTKKSAVPLSAPFSLVVDSNFMVQIINHETRRLFRFHISQYRKLIHVLRHNIILKVYNADL